MLTKIRLLKAWSWDGTDYTVDQLLEVDESTAETLVKDGTAELLTKTASDSEEKIVKSDKGAETTTPGNLVSVEMVKAIVDQTVREVQNSGKAQRPNIAVVKENVEDDPTFGYGKGPRGLAKFLADVRDAGSGHYMPKRLAPAEKAASRLLATKAVGSDELTTVEGALGEFLIPPDYHPELLQKEMEQEFIRSNGAMQIPVTGTTATFNAEVDEDRGVGTLFGGIRVYRDKELTTLTSSRPQFSQIQLTPAPLTGLAYATNYQLHHTPALANILANQFNKAWVQQETREFIKGIGAGECMGIVNAGCKYEQAAETEQAAGTIVTENILNMRSRVYGFQNAIWMASMSCYTHLMSLTLNVGTGGAPVRLFDISQGEPATLLGRPLYFTEMCEDVGTAGDLILANWTVYMIGESSYNEQDTSIHVRFENAQTAFRFIKYMDAHPWWRTTLTLDNDWTVAPYVTLATRS